MHTQESSIGVRDCPRVVGSCFLLVESAIFFDPAEVLSLEFSLRDAVARPENLVDAQVDIRPVRLQLPDCSCGDV